MVLFSCVPMINQPFVCFEFHTFQEPVPSMRLLNLVSAEHDIDYVSACSKTEVTEVGNIILTR